MSLPLISIVVPMYYEEEGVSLFFDRVIPVLEQITENYEVVCVNDGSQDKTLELLLEYHEKDPRIKVIDLARNFGKDTALSAGLDFCQGETVVPMDADLQDPPELIVEMFQKWQEGYDVVYAKRAFRESDTWMKRQTAGGFYKVFNLLSRTAIPDNTGDFRLMDRRVVEVIKLLPERVRFMKGLFAWVGFKSTPIEYNREERAAGETKWGYWKLWNFALDGLTAFTTFPLRVWTYFGLAIASTSFLYAIVMVAKTLIWGIDVPGYASLMVVMLFLGGMNLVGLGVIGEYIGRSYQESKGRPLYIVGDVFGETAKSKQGLIAIHGKERAEVRGKI